MVLPAISAHVAQPESLAGSVGDMWDSQRLADVADWELEQPTIVWKHHEENEQKQRSSFAIMVCLRVETVLRWSGTDSNPGRPFLGCPNYNTVGKKWCGLFMWVDKVLEDAMPCDDRTRHSVDDEEWKMKMA
ncbi:Zinc finger GRF-type protein [Arachis hypogaea]|nr:Zinc finger GRF-type protein [Arachis hypogaea]